MSIVSRKVAELEDSVKKLTGHFTSLKQSHDAMSDALAHVSSTLTQVKASVESSTGATVAAPSVTTPATPSVTTPATPSASPTAAVKTSTPATPSVTTPASPTVTAAVDASDLTKPHPVEEENKHAHVAHGHAVQHATVQRAPKPVAK